MPSPSDQPVSSTGARKAPIRDDQHSIEGTGLVIPLLVEEAAVSRRTVATSVVRVATVTHLRDHLVEEALAREHVEVEHVPVGRYVDFAPAVREEGDVTIVPIVEEVVVVERRLLLREEVHIRRVRSSEQYTENVQLREQDVVITRTPIGERDAPAVPTSIPL